jgi:hypothetical protein
MRVSFKHRDKRMRNTLQKFWSMLAKRALFSVVQALETTHAHSSGPELTGRFLPNT